MIQSSKYYATMDSSCSKCQEHDCHHNGSLGPIKLLLAVIWLTLKLLYYQVPVLQFLALKLAVLQFLVCVFEENPDLQWLVFFRQFNAKRPLFVH